MISFSGSLAWTRAKGLVLLPDAQPKKYIQNAADDMASGSATSNLVIAISAFAVGAAILTFGIFVNRNDSGNVLNLHTFCASFACTGTVG